MTILHKRKDATGYTWTGTDLEEGQIGLNIFDGTIHIKESVAGGGLYVEFQNKTQNDAAYASSAQGSLADSALQNVVEDVTPQLGSNLDLNNWTIFNAGGTNVIMLNTDGAGGAEGANTVHAEIRGTKAGNVGSRSYNIFESLTTEWGADADSTNRYRGRQSTMTHQLKGFDSLSGSVWHDPIGHNMTSYVNNDSTAVTLTNHTALIGDCEVYDNVSITNNTAVKGYFFNSTTGTVTNQIAFEAVFDSLGTNNWVMKSTEATADIEIAGDLIIGAGNTGDVTLGNFIFDADQTVGAGQDNYVLTYDNGTGRITLEATAAAVSALDDLTDVQNLTPSDKHVLIYDGVTDNRYENRLLTEGDISDLQSYVLNSEIDADLKTLSVPASTTISAFGATLVDDADAATARTTLGVDPAGTDNSTDVTLAGTGTYISIVGQVITVDPITESDISDLGTYQSTTEKNAVNGYAGLDGSGLLDPTQLPPLAITSTYVVANEAAQLALTVQEGDVAVRTDENKSYIALNATNATMADWQELLTPTDAVLSVAGKTGVVTLNLADIDDVTATAAEVNLLDLSGLTAGWVLSADTATTASWQQIQAADIAGLAGADTDAIHDNVNGEINAVTAKTTPENSDVILIEDSSASFAKKKMSIADLLDDGTF